MIHAICAYMKLFHRLYSEALKQAATDPTSGKIDVNILTTGVSSAARKRRADIANAVKKLIKSKEKVATIAQQKLFQELRESSDIVSFTLLLFLFDQGCVANAFLCWALLKYESIGVKIS